MPVLCLNWETAHLHGDAWISQHRLRHRLFVERLGWDVRSARGLEHDEFDTPSAHYLVWIDGGGDVRGVARLLPTDMPYMTVKLWPELIDGDLPACSYIWEVSRFGCDRTLNAATRRHAVAELLCAMQEFGMSHGIERYLAVMPSRLLRSVVVKGGCQVTTLGPPKIIGRFPTVAAHLTVSVDVHRELCRRAGINRPVFCSGIPVVA